MKAVLPWVVAVVLGAGLVVVYLSSQKQADEITTLRADSQELQKVRAAAEQTTQNQARAESDELTQLRKDHEDLLRLRNEVRQLRDENTQLNKQAQVAKTPAANPQQQQELAQLQTENQQLKAASHQILQAAQVNACVDILRQIEGAKQQWALEKIKPNGSLVTPADLAPYFSTKTFPVCPGGGVYTLNPIGLAPLCNIPGHALPK
jgi:transposase